MPTLRSRPWLQPRCVRSAQIDGHLIEEFNVITEIDIANYKSVKQLHLELGRVNVFIGENGAGKSNILEAIAMGAAASVGKLDNEFLASRGIRVTNPEWMRSGFPGRDNESEIEVRLKAPDFDYPFKLKNKNSSYSNWSSDADIFAIFFADFVKKTNNGDFSQFFSSEVSLSDLPSAETLGKFKVIMEESLSPTLIGLGKFAIYSPENTSLRNFQKEGQILPIGINGEGLLKLLAVHASEENSTVIQQIKDLLKMLGWFDDFSVKADSLYSRLDLRDRYFDSAIPWVDHRSANEGFFFLLFYFTLFCSHYTPHFFAIDNIDASLNPKLCEKLMLELVKLAKINDKQCLLTTHNPALLDGLNLEDDEQRLFCISRNADGETIVKRVHKPQPIAGQKPARLSELFLRGALGGLPKEF